MSKDPVMIHGPELPLTQPEIACACTPPPYFDLAADLEELIHSLGPRANALGVELVCHVPPSVPTRFVGDSAPLLSCVALLAENAIRVIQQGDILVDVAFGDIEAAPLVSDSGFVPERVPTVGADVVPSLAVGVTATSRNRAAADPTDWNTSVARLVEALGGELTVRQDSGQRRSWTLRLRLETTDAGPARTRPS